MLKVGVIGTGMIGKDHIRRMTSVLSGVEVVAVTDVDASVAASVAAPISAFVHPDGASLIQSPAVDAVVVSSWGPTHEEYVLSAIAAGKPVFCEKPLATTADACRRIVEAEVAAGRRLVQVGYMRRYDVAYRALKAVVDSGEIGRPLMMHCDHRNASVPSFYTKEMGVTNTEGKEERQEGGGVGGRGERGGGGGVGGGAAGGGGGGEGGGGGGRGEGGGGGV